MKYCGKQEIVKTIHTVLEGNKIIGKDVPAFFSQIGITTKGKKINLTEREQQVLSTLAQVGDRKTASIQLGMTKNAVDFHCKNIYKKFDRTKLVAVIEASKKIEIVNFKIICN